MPAADPWAHRRAEPRMLALLWSIYLFAATMMTFGRVASRLAVGPETMAPAARSLLIVIMVGVGVVWPLIRLSQARDPRPIMGPLRDLIVIVLPVYAIIFPQSFVWLAHWPLAVSAAAALAATLWAALIAALLAAANLRAHRHAHPTPPPHGITSATTWAAALLAGLVVFSAIALLDAPTLAGPLGEAPARFRPAWMFSPITSLAEITRERLWTGRSAAVAPGHWLFLAALAVLVAAVWSALAWTSTRPNPPGRAYN